MEAMASGLPCVVSNIRGNTDLLENTNSGFLCEATDVLAYTKKIKNWQMMRLCVKLWEKIVLLLYKNLTWRQ